MAASNKSFVIIGLGTFGSTVAMELVRFGNYVLGIDIDEKRANRLADTLSEVVITDATDEAALREIGLANYDVVLVAVGEDFEACILATMNARLLGAKTIWVKAISRTQHRILSKLGADRIVHPEAEYGQHIAQMLHNPLVKDYVKLGNGFHVFDIEVSKRGAGASVSSLKLAEFDLRCLGLMRGTKFFDCSQPDLLMQVGDLLLILGRRVDLRRFSDSLT